MQPSASSSQQLSLSSPLHMSAHQLLATCLVSRVPHHLTAHAHEYREPHGKLCDNNDSEVLEQAQLAQARDKGGNGGTHLPGARGVACSQLPGMVWVVHACDPLP